MNYLSAKIFIIFILAIFILTSFVFWNWSTKITHSASIGLSIQPVKVSHTINPGESVSGIIKITNVSEEAVKVELKVEDFIPLAGTYNIQFVGRAAGLTTVRDWVVLEKPASLILQKGQEIEVPYTIKAPSNAEPGGHFGVAFFKATELPKGTTKQLEVGTQVGMLIFVTIPGSHLQKGRILEFTGPKFVQRGPVEFTIKFENTGTVHFEPKGTLKITNILGKTVAEVPVEGQVVLPTGVRDLKAQWLGPGFILGLYRADVEIKDGEGNILTAESINFYALPIWYGLGFLAAIAAVYFLIKFIRSRFSFNIARRT